MELHVFPLKFGGVSGNACRSIQYIILDSYNNALLIKVMHTTINNFLSHCPKELICKQQDMCPIAMLINTVLWNYKNFFFRLQSAKVYIIFFLLCKFVSTYFSFSVCRSYFGEGVISSQLILQPPCHMIRNQYMI